MKFELHDRLAASGILLGQCGDVLVLLKNNALFPWVILVPCVFGVRDLDELSEEVYGQVVSLVREVSVWLRERTGAEKLNVGAIGNQVAQLHVHVVARFMDDAAWPEVAWGYGEKKAYGEEEIEAWRGDFARFFLASEVV